MREKSLMCTSVDNKKARSQRHCTQPLCDYVIALTNAPQQQNIFYLIFLTA